AQVHVAHEDRAEEHELRREEHPHPERRGLLAPGGGPELGRGSAHAGFTSGLYAYGTASTAGVSTKFSLGGGELVFHSIPRASHGLGPARSPLKSDQPR